MSNAQKIKIPSKENKIMWLSIVQGWAILLVIIGHANCFTYEEAPAYPVITYGFYDFIHRFCYAFHMPLFMFVSGGLLYYSRISRGFSVKALYVDKLKRLLLPYLFITIIAFFIKGLLVSNAKRGVDMSVGGFFNALFDPNTGPMIELWFVGTLMWLMALYPVYKVALKSVWTELILLGVTLIAFIIADDISVKGWFSLNNVFSFSFFFVGGILFFKYSIYRWFERRIWLTIAVTILFFVMLEIRASILFTSIPGILMSIGWGVTIVYRFPGMFSWFRDYSYQIYLLGLFPQMFVELFVWTKVHNAWLQVPYVIVSCASAIIFAIVVSKITKRFRPAWMRWLIGLK